MPPLEILKRILRDMIISDSPDELTLDYGVFGLSEYNMSKKERVLSLSASDFELEEEREREMMMMLLLLIG